ncbi:MAG: GntR family transcriptional regulator [Bacteroidetes bacterium]|nr:GntR family transcriptional regulator [Bacteroidota bacterium]
MNTSSIEVNKTKASMISVSLRNAIIFGDLKPGEKITESKISKKFNTSHIPVREALKQLEREGFIESKAYSGNNVRKVSDNNLREFNLLHKMFIRNFLKFAIPLYTAADYKQFSIILKKIESSKDYREASLLLIELNTKLYAPANMPYMSSLLKKLFYDNLIYLSVFFKEISKGKISIGYINKFLKLCRNGKTKEATAFWIRKQDQGIKILIKHFKKEKENNYFN